MVIEFSAQRRESEREENLTSDAGGNTGKVHTHPKTPFQTHTILTTHTLRPLPPKHTHTHKYTPKQTHTHTHTHLNTHLHTKNRRDKISRCQCPRVFFPFMCVCVCDRYLDACQWQGIKNWM